MKKILALLLALVMVLALAACGGETAEDTKAPENDVEATVDAGGEVSADAQTVGIAMPTKSLERWNRDGTYLKEQFEAAGYNVLLTYSDNDVTQQNNDISNLIAEGVDMLIVAAIDGDSLTQVLADAKDAGIPVISYDRLIMNTDAISYYVSFDNYTVGVLQGQYVIDTLGLDVNDTSTTYNIEFTGGDPADNNAGYFFGGAYDTLKPYIDAGILNVVSGQTAFEQVATASWSTDTAMERMQNILASYYSDGTVLDIALCSNDSTALGVAQAIATDYAGSNQPIVTGQDGDIANLQNIVDGKQSMTVYKNVSDEAIVTLKLAQAVLAGESPAEDLVAELGIDCSYDVESYDNGTGIIPSYLLVPYVITADNLDLLVETGLYVWEGDYLVSATNE